MHVIVKLKSAAANDVLAQSGDSPTVHALRILTGEASLDFLPLAPEAEDELRTYFALHAEDFGTGQDLAARLLVSPCVEAAYVKPEDEPP